MAATYETDGGTSSMAELDHRSPASTESPLPLVAQYGVAVALVAAATALAFGARAIVAAPNLSLIYVLPVVVAGASLSLGPSVVTVILGVMSFDFFFTQPYLTLRISDPSEIWAAALLFVIAAM